MQVQNITPARPYTSPANKCTFTGVEDTSAFQKHMREKEISYDRKFFQMVDEALMQLSNEFTKSKKTLTTDAPWWARMFTRSGIVLTVQDGTSRIRHLVPANIAAVQNLLGKLGKMA